MQILNLTQHKATAAQIAAGVVDSEKESLLQKILEVHLNFENLPEKRELESRARLIANAAKRECATHAMIGGAPFFMPFLERALQEKGIKPLYAFSKRVSVEEVQADGSVRKVNVFRHIGFVEV